MTDSDALERTLATARAAFVAPVAARARLRAGLHARGAFDAAKTNTAAALVRGGVARSTVSVLVVLGFAAGYWLGRAQPSAPVATALPVAPVVSGPSPASGAPAESPVAVRAAETPLVPTPTPNAGEVRSSDAAPASAERAHAPRPRIQSGPRSAPSSKVNAFAEELALLQRAERALRAGEAELALSLVGELERRYPESTLTEERSALRILAECTAAVPDARARAERFLSDRVASVYTDRVRRVCQLGTAVQLGESDGSRSSGH